MSKTRDDFTSKTIDILAKRVGYLCSNPDCKRPTIGPNSDPEKATTIGIAAHITAASSGGPRFDTNLSTQERKHIDNGIWLCSNCATLIDKDEEKYPVELLDTWRKEAEYAMEVALKGTALKSNLENQVPFLEMDLIWSSGGRWHKGYSVKNKSIGDGIIRPGTGTAIIHWEINWKFSLVIYNNSNYPAFNIKLEHVKGTDFTYIEKLKKVNNLGPLENKDLKANYITYFEGNSVEADKRNLSKIPAELAGLIYDIVYYDQQRTEYKTRFILTPNEIINKKM